MASSASENSFDACDSSNDEDMPGLISGNDEDSASDDTEVYTSPEKINDKNSEVVEDYETGEEVETSYTSSKHANASICKRKSTHGNAKVQKRKMSRNKTHASKLQCCDAEEIKKCLCSNKACCKKQCLMKLRQHRDKAINALAELRHQRFAGQSAISMKLVTRQITPPG